MLQSRTHSPSRALYKGPTLIIHPEKDEAIPVSHARDFFRAAGAEAKELVIIAGADHVYTSIPWEQEVIAPHRTVVWAITYSPLGRDRLACQTDGAKRLAIVFSLEIDAKE